MPFSLQMAFSISSNFAKLIPFGSVKANPNNGSWLLKCQNSATALQLNVKDMTNFLWFIDIGKCALYR